MINIIAAGQVCTAIVDLGSVISLIKRRTVQRLKLPVQKVKQVHSLSGITGQPLRVLGMVKLNVQVGAKGTHEQMVPVVPDSYLNKDLLL